MQLHLYILAFCLTFIHAQQPTPPDNFWIPPAFDSFPANLSGVLDSASLDNDTLIILAPTPSPENVAYGHQIWASRRLPNNSTELRRLSFPADTRVIPSSGFKRIYGYIRTTPRFLLSDKSRAEVFFFDMHGWLWKINSSLNLYQINASSPFEVFQGDVAADSQQRLPAVLLKSHLLVSVRSGYAKVSREDETITVFTNVLNATDPLNIEVCAHAEEPLPEHAMIFGDSEYVRGMIVENGTFSRTIPPLYCYNPRVFRVPTSARELNVSGAPVQCVVEMNSYERLYIAVYGEGPFWVERHQLEESRRLMAVGKMVSIFWEEPRFYYTEHANPDIPIWLDGVTPFNPARLDILQVYWRDLNPVNDTFLIFQAACSGGDTQPFCTYPSGYYALGYRLYRIDLTTSINGSSVILYPSVTRHEENTYGIMAFPPIFSPPLDTVGTESILFPCGRLDSMITEGYCGSEVCAIDLAESITFRRGGFLPRILPSRMPIPPMLPLASPKSSPGIQYYHVAYHDNLDRVVSAFDQILPNATSMSCSEPQNDTRCTYADGCNLWNFYDKTCTARIGSPCSGNCSMFMNGICTNATFPVCQCVTAPYDRVRYCSPCSSQAVDGPSGVPICVGNRTNTAGCGNGVAPDSCFVCNSYFQCENLFCTPAPRYPVAPPISPQWPPVRIASPIHWIFPSSQPPGASFASSSPSALVGIVIGSTAGGFVVIVLIIWGISVAVRGRGRRSAPIGVPPAASVDLASQQATSVPLYEAATAIESPDIPPSSSNYPVHLERHTHCAVCFDAPPSVVLAPCGHVFCSECCERLQACALCRHSIVSRIELHSVQTEKPLPHHNTTPGMSTCVICKEMKEMAFAFSPCGHMACVGCNAQRTDRSIRRCPECKNRIRDVVGIHWLAVDASEASRAISSSSSSQAATQPDLSAIGEAPAATIELQQSQENSAPGHADNDAGSSSSSEEEDSSDPSYLAGIA